MLTRFLFVLIGALCLAPKALAQTYYRVEDANTAIGLNRGQKITALTCAAGRWTGWINVKNWRALVLEITNPTYGAATSVDVRCESSQSSATADDAGEDIHVIVSTAATGVSTTEIDTRRNNVSATERWDVTFTNIPAPWINCNVICPAGTTDTVSVFARVVTP